MQNRLKHSRHAFTLVELLVVISIIALLMSILMPSLNRARSTAQRLVCSTQMRQSGIAVAMYLSDNKETYMFYSDSALIKTFNPKDSYQVANNRWYQKLLNGKYYEKPEILACPSHKIPAAYNTKKINQGYYMLDTRLSYGMSIAFGIDYSQSHYPARAWQSFQIAKPSETILFTDSAHSKYPEIGAYAIYGFYRDPKQVTFGDDLVAWPRHNGGYCNVLWADCHTSTVKATNPKEPASLYDDNSLTRVLSRGKNNWIVKTK